MRFTGKTAVVTGARSGIGRATARRFAEEGAQVVLADIREADGEARALTEAGHSAIAVQADVSDEGQVAELMEQALATYGRIDILVNNAGVELTKTVADTTLAEWDHLMAVNLRG
ncbi:MAG: SDR family NAD(P)-dependent oxidoreductase, partial [Gammaproteobacteria bacterium]|nr:SDR family NAD(P)-dependent oxidoreductase [Gammaproteobacteria bacterium]NIR58743.1 SDR family NAD(P)-dependent oxidoreductase [Gammaproteobacteria bacterium]NIR88597.1 SDR family NAD(P)-dependent oxidoreductase [Gammaproteobacteria bacterium]